MVTVDEFQAADKGKPPATGWLGRIDDIAERFGDAVNPILIKETRF